MNMKKFSYKYNDSNFNAFKSLQMNHFITQNISISSTYSILKKFSLIFNQQFKFELKLISIVT